MKVAILLTVAAVLLFALAVFLATGGLARFAAKPEPRTFITAPAVQLQAEPRSDPDLAIPQIDSFLPQRASAIQP